MNHASLEFRQAAPERMKGLESELNVQQMPIGLRHVPLKDHVPNALITASLSEKEGASRGVFLKNGGLIYWENARLLESATPPSTDTDVLLRNIRMGEIVAVIATKSIAPETRLFNRTGSPTIILPNGEQALSTASAGFHENYFFPHLQGGKEQPIIQHIRPKLHSFLASRIVWSGTGMVTQDGFAISQKTHTLNAKQPFAPLTSGIRVNKPFFSIKNDRLEVRTGEGHMSDWATKQSFDMTSLVLRLIEHDAFPDSLILADADRAMGSLTHNPNARVMLKNGTEITGVHHQRLIGRAIAELGDAINLPLSETEALKKHFNVLDDLENVSIADADVRAVHDRVDWAAKFSLLHRAGMTPNSTTPRDPKMLMLDLKWEELTSEKNIAHAWYKKLGQNILTLTLDDLLTIPPPGSRSALQVELIDYLDHRHPGNVVGADWDTVHTRTHIYDLGDPYSKEAIRSRR